MKYNQAVFALRGAVVNISLEQFSHVEVHLHGCQYMRVAVAKLQIPGATNATAMRAPFT